MGHLGEVSAKSALLIAPVLPPHQRWLIAGSPIHSEAGVRVAIMISPLEPGACKNKSRWMRTTDCSVISSSGSCSTCDRAQKSLSRYNEAGQEEMDENSHGLTRAAWLTICLSPSPQAGGTPQLGDSYKSQAPPEFKSRKSFASWRGGREAVAWSPDCWSSGLGAVGTQTPAFLGPPRVLISPSSEEQ